jgi:hypothetical protein
VRRRTPFGTPWNTPRKACFPIQKDWKINVLQIRNLGGGGEFGKSERGF